MSLDGDGGHSGMLFSKPLKDRITILSRRSMRSSVQNKYAPNSLFIPRGRAVLYVDNLIDQLVSFLHNGGYHVCRKPDIERLHNIIELFCCQLKTLITPSRAILACQRGASPRSIPKTDETQSIVEAMCSWGFGSEIRKILWSDKETGLMV